MALQSGSEVMIYQYFLDSELSKLEMSRVRGFPLWHLEIINEVRRKFRSVMVQDQAILSTCN